jgi:hypothetical protein
MFFPKYRLNSWLWNGGPLSLFNTFGIPCVAKIRASFNIVDFEDVELTISTSGNREYASTNH